MGRSRKPFGALCATRVRIPLSPPSPAVALAKAGFAPCSTFPDSSGGRSPRIGDYSITLQFLLLQISLHFRISKYEKPIQGAYAPSSEMSCKLMVSTGVKALIFIALLINKMLRL